MNVQEQMKELLTQSGIPAKEIKVYGSQIMITAFGADSADKWASLLAKLCRKVRSCQSTDYAVENKNTVMMPSTVKVWRVWGTV